jgi:hypothetical protein
MKALIITSRDLVNEKNGRVQVLDGYIRMLNASNVDLSILVIGGQCDNVAFLDKYGFIENFYKVEFSFVNYFLSFISSVILGESLNINVFYNKKVVGFINANNLGAKFDFLYLDTIRYFKYGELFDAKIVLDFDDLYSNRYLEISKNKTDVPILGFLNDRIPRFIQRPVEYIVRMLLSREAKLLANEEVSCAKSVDYSNIVSNIEAKLLSETSGVSVTDIPMVIDIDHGRLWQEKKLDSLFKLVMVGSIKLQQNYQTIKLADRLLKSGSLEKCKLYIIGDIEGCNLSEFHESIIFLGFVDDLYEELSKYDCYFSPIYSGTGIKTKNLEAIGFGMPLVTSSKGVEGTELSKYCYVVEEWDEFNLCEFRCKDYPGLLLNRTDGIDYVKKTFGYNVLLNKVATQVLDIKISLENS